ncbi:MAG: N-acetylmuramoyl-L-alanine amidase, partial [Gordonibacter sp.]|uniref:N-acetylmuramoyl-L-alanine amidase n=1 Tax=Gordonibacter sp. TaxID=1968902 RepID=UPI002FC944B9
KNSVSGTIRMEVAEALGIPFLSIPGIKVYVDAGHGWNDSNNGAYDPGASSGGFQEAALTKELAGMVSQILKNSYGIDVFLNDDGGWYKLRHAEAIAQGCDAIVSLHFNAGGGTGTESLIHNYNAAPFSSNWQRRIHPYLCNTVGLVDRGMKTQEVAILGGRLPSTLLEICFIDNGSDMSQYQRNKVQIAQGIAEGIAR